MLFLPVAYAAWWLFFRRRNLSTSRSSKASSMHSIRAAQVQKQQTARAITTRMERGSGVGMVNSGLSRPDPWILDPGARSKVTPETFQCLPRRKQTGAGTPSMLKANWVFRSTRSKKAFLPCPPQVLYGEDLGTACFRALTQHPSGRTRLHFPK